MTILFIYTVFISLFIGSLWRPIFGVLGYLSVYTLYDPYIWWGASFQQYLPRPSLVAVIFLITGVFLHAKSFNWHISRREVEFYLFLAAAWLISLVFGVGIEDNNWIYLTKLTKLFVFIFFFIRVVNSLDSYDQVVWTLILSAIFLAYQAHTVGDFHGGRLNNLGGIDFREANGFASFLAAAITFLGVRLLWVPLWKKAIYVVGIALMLNSIIMTRSRAVFLGLVMAGLYAAFRAPAKYRKHIYVVGILGVILFFMMVDAKFLERMDTIQYQLQDSQEETISRLDFWKASIQMFMDHPLGVGVKNFEKMVPYYDPRNKGMDAHNTYVLCYAEIGIIGIALFLIIIAETFLQLRRIRLAVKNTQHENEITLHYVFAIATVLIIYLLGYMMTHSILYTEILWILLAMPICLENATQKLLEKGKNRGFEDEKVGS